VPIENPVTEGAIGFFGLGGLALSIGIIILTQNEIIGEKQSGTAEWVLSKPVSRSAFLLSKLVANAVAVLVIMIVLQGTVAYGLLSAFDPGAVALPDFLTATGMLALHVFFYLGLTLMMGVIAEDRETVLGVSLGTLLVGMLARDFIGRLALFTPWLLSDLAGTVAVGEPLTAEMWLSSLSTVVWSLIFIAVAVWRFEKHEF
jgi:ABC-2 type transport system permease protein